MASNAAARPRVSRETRLLLGTVLLSLVALWVLGRLRFPDRTGSVNPVPAVLNQLAPRSTFDDLASAVARATTPLAGSVVALPSSQGDSGRSPARSAIRLRDDMVVTLMSDEAADAEARHAGASVAVIARDAASGLAIVRVPPGQAPLLETWAPRRPEAPRYLMASVLAGAVVSWQPVFVAALTPVTSPRWRGTIWATPSPMLLVPGAFVFTLSGAWAGMVAEHPGGTAIVPAALVIDVAEALMASGPREPATVGIEVELASPLIASVAGATSGVVVTWIDPSGPAARDLVVTDVIESVGGYPLVTVDDWTARVRRLSPGDTLDLRVRRRGTSVDVRLTGAPVPVAPMVPVLGLTMRTVRNIGTVVVGVQAGSIADRAGLRIGDVLTLVGDVPAPTPAQVSRAVAATPVGRPLAVALTRGEAHHVLALVK